MRDEATGSRDEDGDGDAPASGDGLGRRAFLGAVGAGAAAAALGLAGAPGRAAAVDGRGAAKPGPRAAAAYRARVDAARLARRQPGVRQQANGEEQDYPFVATYSKGLPHDARGDVDPAAYRTLRRALAARRPQAFEAVVLGLGRPLVSPQAGLAYDLEGPDSHHVTLPPAPRIDGPECSGEMAELYWMALARDVPFAHWDDDSLTNAAAADLTARYSDFRGPREGGAVTPATLFRGTTPGDLVGPYLSQLLWRDIPFGAQTLVQRSRTTLPGVDHLTDLASWLEVQDGRADLVGTDAYDPEPRYLRSLRDIAEWVHVDAIAQAYQGACMILLGMGAPFDPGMPLQSSATQEGFAEWGPPHVLTLVAEVATRALKAVWYQKWFVHRRLRPEEFGGRVHQMMTGNALYPIDPEILEGGAVAAVASRTGSHLLPMAVPEGCPLHPAYGAGHATVAGACTTVLKAWFDGDHELPDPVVASADGRTLQPWSGEPLRVEGELDKLAANVSLGRNAAGFHWRSDYTESVRLGERVALQILREQKLTTHHDARLTLTSFDGERIVV